MQHAGRVLVIDESALTRRELEGLLRVAGYEVKLAKPAPDTPETARAFAADVIVAGLDPTVSQQRHLISRLAEASGAGVLCLLTDALQGPQSSELARLAQSSGAQDVLHRPARPGWTNTMGGVLLRKLSKIHLSKAPRLPAARPGERQPAVQTSAPGPAMIARPARPDRFPIFLVGCSSGGPQALQAVLSSLPGSFPGALVVAQHMKAGATRAFATRLATKVALPVREVSDHVPVEAGGCYIAAGGADLVFTRRRGRFVIASVPADPSLPFHPSVDRMVRSAAEAVPIERLRAVLLTGIGQDGASAIADLHAKGVPTIAESEETCLVFGMPARLIEMGGAGSVLPITKIGPALQKLTEICSRKPTARAAAQPGGRAVDRLADRALRKS